MDVSDPTIQKEIAGFCARHERRMVALANSIMDKVSNVSSDHTKPLAAILDIDEVLLCNVHMHATDTFFAADHYPAAGSGWPGDSWPRDDTRLNPLLPGARELLNALEGAGAAIFFVTGRRERLRDETIENFLLHGITVASDHLYMCPDDYDRASIASFKAAARAEIAATHTVFLNVGDQLTDLGEPGPVHGIHQVLLPHGLYSTP